MWASLTTHQHTPVSRRGFTIVELLIVIVVIGILAAITIVAFNGVQNRAKAGAAQSAVAQANKKILSFAAENSDAYPVAAGPNGIDNLTAIGIVGSGNATYQYSSANNVSPRTFCLTATVGDRSYYISSASVAPTSGACQGHGLDGAIAITNYATNPHAVGNVGWGSQTPAGSTLSYVANGAQDGGSAYQVATTQAGQLRISAAQSLGNVSTGDQISVSIDIFAPEATSVQVELGVAGVFPKSSAISLTSGWNRVFGTATIPAGITNSPVTLVQITSVSTVSTGKTWKASRILLTRGTANPAYADGETSGWLWNGGVNNSTSTGSVQ